MRRRLLGLPLRLRLTLAIALAMAVAFTVLSLFVYLRFRADLMHALDNGLRARLRDVATLAAEGPLDRARLFQRERLAQVYDARGRPLASGGDLSMRMLTGAEARRAAAGPLLIARRDTDEGPLRIVAGPVRRANGGRAAAAVGENLSGTDDQLSNLAVLLAIVGPIALLLASFAGHEVAGAALRPVERMRARAQSITEHNLSERLPLPPTEDEIGRLGATLNELLDRLESAVTRERRVVSDASHELRTPLAVLRTELQLALRGERPAGELRAALESALSESERLARLADDLLVLARADQGRLPLRAEPLDAQELLEGVAARLRPQAERAGREVSVAVQVPGGAVLLADPDRAAQALDGLAANALRHGAGPIDLVATAHDGQVELHVLDRGPGFEETFLPRAFERFSRGEGRGEGSGLGLAIVDAIAAAHGARAGARNRPGGGADAWIALPDAAEVGAAPDASPAARG
jgi:signal transduction histidine kinase